MLTDRDVRTRVLFPALPGGVELVARLEAGAY